MSENFFNENDIKIEVNGSFIYSFPLALIDFNIIDEIIITNNTNNLIKNAKLHIKIDLGFIEEEEIDIYLLNPHQPLLIDKINLKAHLDDLISIANIKEANIVISLVSENNIIAKYSNVVTFYPYNYLINDISKDIIALYVSEYDFKVNELIKKNKDLLYKNDIKVIESIIKNENISLINFNNIISLPFMTLNKKEGTYLDLAILFASFLKALNINFHILLANNKAYIKVISNDNTLIIDSTSLTLNHTKVKIIENELNIIDDIDVYSLANDNYLPLPIKYSYNKISVDYQLLLKNRNTINNKKETLDTTSLNKFEIWEKKLLDLSKRNQLINYRANGKNLQIDYFDLDALYQAFNNKNKSYQLLSENTIKDDDFIEVESDSELKSYFNKNHLRVFIKNQNQATSLRYFEKERKKAFEEVGSNILYLAIGFLKYYESKSSSYFYAPLIMLPIDLIKQSKGNYAIIGREEPAFLNISIFEYFHLEYKINFDDLLKTPFFDDDNITIDYIFNTILSKLKDIKKVSIIKAAAIGIFNFSSAVMYFDVKDNKEEFVKNKIVKSLIENHYLLNEKINDDVSDNDLAIPLLADSSQIKAIKASISGTSFILQGPPGTGKSQTITNMIVNAMYHNKTVLFVAEKQAALDVVRKRLADLCLDKFVLIAHSIKQDKTSLMSQFEQRVELGSIKYDINEFLSLQGQLDFERRELDKIITSLHSKNDYFLSFYDAFVNYLNIDEKIKTIKVSNDYLLTLNDISFTKACNSLNRLANELKLNDGYINNPFLLYRKSNYIPSVDKNNLLELATNYKNDLSEFINSFNNFNKANLFSFDMSYKVVKALLNVLSNEKEIKESLSTLFDVNIDNIDNDINEIINIGISYNELVLKIKTTFIDSIFKYDYSYAINTYNNLNNMFFLKRVFAKKKLFNEFKLFYKNIHDFKESDLIDTCNTLALINNKEKELIKKMNSFKLIFADLTNLKEFDFALFNKRYLLTKQLINDKAISLDIIKLLINKIKTYSLLNSNELVDSYNKIAEDEYKLEIDCSFDFSYLVKNKITYDKLLIKIDKMIKNIDDLPLWCSLLNAYNECVKNNLDEFLILIDKNVDLENVYKKSIYEAIMYKELTKDKKASFNSFDLKFHIDFYKKTLDKFKELTIKETAARVSANMPLINDNSPHSSEQGILNKAIKNKCKGKGIRKLFTEIADILPKIFPVFLMSPISAAQYLSVSNKFDIVIFDEASQIPTSKAISAICKGKSLIVVGDSKQMPPSSFFKSKDDDEIDSSLDDLDSILDDLDAINMPQLSLTWHYRSKHESLIRFSNAKFYNNKLITFPSTNDMVSKVKFINTNGIYGGKSATNEIEAKAIIKEVERRLRDSKLNKFSIGIVTFSSVQQELIEDMLSDFFTYHKDLERINLANKEPIIVKNLENIQGDERDVILFSICYGPDSNNNMYYRFGPLNNMGGEKRLNVAISRARYEMLVFASFEVERLANMKTNSIGAKELYSFLKYAKYGNEALLANNSNIATNNVGFEKQLAEKLTERGYKCVIDVGNSSFKVDIGIINPSNENEYLLGVLCDSYSYENTLTSKDRNIIQPTVLKLLNWNLIRVYSFDYLDNPNKVVDEICERFEDIKLNNDLYNKKEVSNDKISIEYESNNIEAVDLSKPYIVYDKKINRKNIDFDLKCKIILDILSVEAPISEELLKNRYKEITSSPINDISNVMLFINAKKNKNLSLTKTFYWNVNQEHELTYYRNNKEYVRSIDDIAKEEIFVAIKEVLLNNGAINKNELIRLVAKLFSIKMVTKKVEATIDDCISCYITMDELINNNDKIDLKEK